MYETYSDYIIWRANDSFFQIIRIWQKKLQHHAKLSNWLIHSTQNNQRKLKRNPAKHTFMACHFSHID